MQQGIAQRVGDQIVLPGIGTTHSHAFQRALRGRTQRRASHADSFWSWRGLMYELANRLGPDDLYAISHFAFVELALSGVTAVGEFHYVHHQPDGTPYGDRTLLSETVIRAARDAGLRICLLRVVYERAGAGKPALPEQRRFCDAKVEDAMRDTLALSEKFRGDPLVRLGIAPHSVRAVSRPWLQAIASFVSHERSAYSMHVSEQRREIDECVAEHGMRPIELLDAAGALSDQLIAVHATHLADNEIELLGRARVFACLCRSTERDLGDGASVAASLLRSGARLCTGIDSHAISDPFEEARAIELDARVSTESRHVVTDAPRLLEALCGNAYAALHFDATGDSVVLDATDPSLAGASDELLDDAVAFGATPRAVHSVTVNGRKIVHDGKHDRYDAARTAFEKALKQLLG